MSNHIPDPYIALTGYDADADVTRYPDDELTLDRDAVEDELDVEEERARES